jgi:hypothetical protein
VDPLSSSALKSPALETLPCPLAPVGGPPFRRSVTIQERRSHARGSETETELW